MAQSPPQQQPPQQIGVSARVHSLESARALGAGLYYPHRLTPLSPSSPLFPAESFSFTAVAARLGLVTAGLLKYSSAIRIDTDPYVTSFQVNAPLQGSLRTSVGEQRVQVTNARAAIYGPDVPTAISGWEQPCIMLAVKLDRDAVERRIAAERARLPRHRLDPVLDVSGGAGAAWIAAVRAVIATAQRVPDLDPGLARYLAERCIDGFIFTAFGAEPPTEPPASSDAAIVDRALEAITYTEGPPLSLTSIADYAGVSGRSVQSAFRRLLGETPMQAQRRERMRRAHQELVGARPEQELVSTVALRHGFTHLGRFAAHYRSEYGEFPSQTLER